MAIQTHQIQCVNYVYFFDYQLHLHEAARTKTKQRRLQSACGCCVALGRPVHVTGQGSFLRGALLVVFTVTEGTLAVKIRKANARPGNSGGGQ